LVLLLYFTPGAVSTPLKIGGGVEQQSDEGTERERTGIARNQNVLYLLPHEAAAISQFLPSSLERVAGESGAAAGPGPRLLVVTPDAETAVNISRCVIGASTVEGAAVAWRTVPVTSVRRATRLLAAHAAPIVAGPPEALLELVRRATLKLDAVRALVIAWVDIMVDTGSTPALEALMNEVPKDAARTVIASRTTPAVEALVERYARRPRRVGSSEEPAAEPLTLRYLVSTPDARPAALCRLLDEIDPPAAAVFARDDAAIAEATDALRAFGYGDADDVRVVREAPVPSPSLLVLYELPSTHDALRSLSTTGSQVVALVAPRQLPALRALAGNGCLTPYTFDASLGAARAHDDRARDEIRGVLGAGLPARELLAIEPLLAEFDAASVAAAALRLLEWERSRPVAAPAPPIAAAPVARSAASSTDRGAESLAVARVFINVGTRDGVSTRDLVGAIANEAGIPGARIGRVEVKEGHSIVELSAADAALALEKLAGVTVRGRKLAARMDRDRGERPERGERSGRSGPGGGRGAGGRGERSSRGGPPRGGPPRGAARGTSRGGGGGGPRAPRGPRPSRPTGE
jgi:ATP-dependent RNA helicase DeaD